MLWMVALWYPYGDSKGCENSGRIAAATSSGGQVSHHGRGLFMRALNHGLHSRKKIQEFCADARVWGKGRRGARCSKTEDL